MWKTSFASSLKNTLMPGLLVREGPRAVVVVELTFGHFFRREADAEVVVEIAAVRRHPLELPAHALAKALDVGQWCARDGHQREGTSRVEGRK